jgi:neopullulanase
MKYINYKIIIYLSFFLLAQSLLAQIERVEPSFWWAGMQNPNLQLMIYGEKVAENSVHINNKNISLKAATTLGNPNYLFVDLLLSRNTPPGKFEIILKKDGKVTSSINYQLYEREFGPDLPGFNNSDVMYLIMPDRFANGDPTNDSHPDMADKLNREDPYGRHGGDIKGIRNHLDYIADMGYTAIWLNPLLENDQPEASYHGYATTDFYQVDRRYGSNEEYRALAKEAREKGLKIIMDMIFNHCGTGHWWMDDLPSDDWINHYPDFFITNHRRTVNQDPHASAYDTERMIEGWFVPEMPDLNQQNPYLANYLIQNSIWWIEYLGLAGIRMDTYPYPDKYMMAEWNRRVLYEYPYFNIVGEEWSENPAITSYWQAGQINPDGYEPHMPSVMDFPLQSALSKALNEPEDWGTGWITLYRMVANDFLYPNPYNLVVFPDNHDMARFYMQVGADLELYKIGLAYILTTRGIPQIFYGSEMLLTHSSANEHGDIRKDFPGGWPGDEVNAFTGEGLNEDQEDIMNYISTLLNWRKNNPAIHNGKLLHFVPENGVYTYFRFNSTEKVMIVLNKSIEDVPLSLEPFREIFPAETSGRDVITGKTYNLKDELVIPARTPLILELNE